MDVEFKIEQAQLLEYIKAKNASFTFPPCSFCGGRAQRDIIGVHWMTVDDDFAYRLSTPHGSQLHQLATSPKPGGPPVSLEGKFAGPVQPRPGVMPCAVFACSACGNVWLLSLHVLGLFSVTGNKTPVLRLIHGGADDNEIAKPEDGVTT